MSFKLGLPIIAVTALVVGVICIIQWRNNKNREHVIIKGQIIGFLKRTNSNGTYFYPIFEYFYNGNTYKNEGKFGTATIKNGKKAPMSKYKEGDEIEVLVFCDDLSEGIINTKGNINLSLYFGLGALAVGILLGVIWFLVWGA